MSAVVIPKFDETRIGVDEHAISRALASTLGPFGRPVVFENPGYASQSEMRLHKGWAISREVARIGAGPAELGSFLDWIGTLANGGASTTALLVGLSIVRGMRLAFRKGANAAQLEQGIQMALGQADKAIVLSTIRLERSRNSLEAVCATAASDIELGRIAADALLRTDVQETISIIPGRTGKDEIIELRAVRLRARIVAHNLEGIGPEAGDENTYAYLEDPTIVIYHVLPDRRAFLHDIGDIVMFLRPKQRRKSVVVFVPTELADLANHWLADVTHYAETTLAVLQAQSNPIELEALAKLARPEKKPRVGRVIESGQVGSVIFEAGLCTVLECPADAPHESDQFARRSTEVERKPSFSALCQKLPVILLDSPSPGSWSERRSKLADALSSGFQATHFGAIAGGGAALARARQAIKLDSTQGSDYLLGGLIVQEAMTAPLCAIVSNRERSPIEVLRRLDQGDELDAYDAWSDEVGSAVQYGVLDPQIVALHALSVAMTSARWVMRMEDLDESRGSHSLQPSSISSVVDTPYLPPRLVRPDPRSYRLWFGTDCRPVDGTNPLSGFESTPDGKVHYGTCVVEVPDYHSGQTGRTWIYRVFRSTPAPRCEVVSIEAEEKASFIKDLEDCMSRLPEGRKELLLVVHGYRVIFDGAARHAAQIAMDLKIDGPTVFFAWPSCGSMAAYMADEATVVRSESRFCEFLECVLSIRGVSAVNVVAHSMGNRLLMSGVKHLSSNATLPRLGQIVLVAPDLDSATFLDSVGHYELAKQPGARISLYWNSRDKALRASTFAHGAKRIGMVGGFPYRDHSDSIRWCDDRRWSLIKLGHSYHVESAPVVDDIRAVLVRKAPPSERHLKPRPSDRPTHWDLDGES